MKGDRVEIVIDAGGTPLTYEVTATRAGRRVEVTIGRGVVEVAEVTRGGTVVRTARFMSSRVLALVEHPVARREVGDPAPRGEQRSRLQPVGTSEEERRLPNAVQPEQHHYHAVEPGTQAAVRRGSVQEGIQVGLHRLKFHPLLFSLSDEDGVAVLALRTRGDLDAFPE